MGIYFLACHRIHTIAAFFKKKKKKQTKESFLRAGIHKIYS